MDMGPSSHSRATRRRRVSSPRAAKRGALELWRTDKIRLDQLHRHTPTLLVGRESPGAALERDLVEARFGDGEHDALCLLREDENDQRGGLGGVVNTGLNGAGVPAEGKQSLGLDPLDGDLE